MLDLNADVAETANTVLDAGSGYQHEPIGTIADRSSEKSRSRRNSGAIWGVGNTTRRRLNTRTVAGRRTSPTSRIPARPIAASHGNVANSRTRLGRCVHFVSIVPELGSNRADSFHIRSIDDWRLFAPIIDAFGVARSSDGPFRSSGLR